MALLLCALCDAAMQQIGEDIEADANGDEGGYSVAITPDGDRIVIGIPGEDNNNGVDAGRVRVYDYNAGRSNDKIRQLSGDNMFGPSAGARFGHAVAVSGSRLTVCVGSPKSDDTTTPGATKTAAGAIFVYRRTSDNTNWFQHGSTLYGLSAGDQFGSAIAVSADGSVLAGGSYKTSSDQGHVRVFEYRSSGGGGGKDWFAVGASIVGSSGGERFAWSIALASSAMRVAAGAPHAGTSNLGSVRIALSSCPLCNDDFPRCGVPLLTHP